MKPMKKRLQSALVLLLIAALVSGCSNAIPLKGDSGATLPPPREPFAAPQGDAGDSEAATVLLCLPDAHTGRLRMFPERILVSRTRHPAEYTLRKLFSFTGTTQANPLTREVNLGLHPGSMVEVSGDTAVVNLAASALALNNKDRYQIARAITNTLTQWGDIRYVNLLINGRQQGVDTAATMPQGSLSQSSEEDFDALWESVSRSAAGEGAFSSIATLYFPALAGRGILAEARMINFPGRSLPVMANTLLEALSTGALTLPNVPKLPDLIPLLTEEPSMIEQSDSSGRVLRLRFREAANEALINAGVPRSIMMASLCTTLTTFLPLVTGVQVFIGQEPVNAVVPAGILEGAGVQIFFDQGIMHRSQFNRFLLDHCTLYFADSEGSLTASLRPLPYYQINSPRTLIAQLMAGPQNTDSQGNLLSVMPPQVKEADLLGLDIKEDTVLINLSSQFTAAAKDFDAQQEQRLVYALVNTLTGLRGIKRVRFFVDGKTDGVFVKNIDVAGEFLRNEGLIQH